MKAGEGGLTGMGPLGQGGRQVLDARSATTTDEESGASLVENASMCRDERVSDGGEMVADVCGGSGDVWAMRSTNHFQIVRL